MSQHKRPQDMTAEEFEDLQSRCSEYSGYSLPLYSVGDRVLLEKGTAVVEDIQDFCLEGLSWHYIFEGEKFEFDPYDSFWWYGTPEYKIYGRWEEVSKS